MILLAYRHGLRAGWCRLMPLSVISQRRGTSVAFGAKRTWAGWQDGVNRSRM